MYFQDRPLEGDPNQVFYSRKLRQMFIGKKSLNFSDIYLY